MDSELDVTGFCRNDKAPEHAKSCIKRRDATKLPDSELPSYELNKGFVVRPGDTVELHSELVHDCNSMQSGDFLRVKHIIHDVQTDKVRLRGYRLRRNKYLGQLLPCEYLFINFAIMLTCSREIQ